MDWESEHDSQVAVVDTVPPGNGLGLTLRRQQLGHGLTHSSREDLAALAIEVDVVAMEFRVPSHRCVKVDRRNLLSCQNLLGKRVASGSTRRDRPRSARWQGGQRRLSQPASFPLQDSNREQSNPRSAGPGGDWFHSHERSKCRTTRWIHALAARTCFQQRRGAWQDRPQEQASADYPSIRAQEQRFLS